MSGRLGIDDLEDLRTARLTGDGAEELLATQSETTLVVNGPDGWPRGVVVSFVRDDDRFWIVAVEGRGYVKAIREDPRVSLVVSNAGTVLEGRRMLAVRGEATVHADPAVVARAVAMVAGRLAPADPSAMVRLLDSPNRLAVEIRPVAVSVSHDSRRIAGDGRGGGRQPATTAATGE